MKKGNIILSFLIFLMVLLSGFLLYLIFITNNIHNSFESRSDTKNSSKIETVKNEPLKNNISFVLLGLDRKSDEDNSQRADTIIVGTYNIKKNNIVMSRIPRDVYIKIANYEGKINGIYHDLDRESLIKVIENYTNLPINYYVQTDFDGLKNIIDSIGGININSKITINEFNNQQIGNDIFIKQGKNHLNGKEALAYSRIRYIDDDIERGKRQEQVISAMINKLLTPSELINVGNNINVISKYVKTNVSTKVAINHINSLSNKPNIKSIPFEWEGFEYNGSSFVKLKDGERLKVSQQLRSNINLPKRPLPILNVNPN